MATGFFAGVSYQKNQTPTSDYQSRAGARTRLGQNNAVVRGQVISADERSVSVKTQNGSSKIILMSPDSAIGKMEEASKSAITVGSTIAAFGTQNSDGSITAANIQLNPGNLRGFGGNNPELIR